MELTNLLQCLSSLKSPWTPFLVLYKTNVPCHSFRSWYFAALMINLEQTVSNLKENLWNWYILYKGGCQTPWWQRPIFVGHYLKLERIYISRKLQNLSTLLSLLLLHVIHRHPGVHLLMVRVVGGHVPGWFWWGHSLIPSEIPDG